MLCVEGRSRTRASGGINTWSSSDSVLTQSRLPTEGELSYFLTVGMKKVIYLLFISLTTAGIHNKLNMYLWMLHSFVLRENVLVRGRHLVLSVSDVLYQ